MLILKPKNLILKMKGIFFVVALFTLPIYSQTANTTENKLTNNIHLLSNYNAPENIYLQTSKGLYETGENLWFKSYILDSKYLAPSNQSKILFIQLLEDASNKPVWEEKYEIENGFVDGHLFLQDTLKPGAYTLVAYSAHSFYKNHKDFNAVRKIQVLQRIQNKPVLKQIAHDSTMHFTTFPEGGNLVSGIESRLAFKTVNSKGLPITTSGILHENNTPIVHFKSNAMGMGSFLFLPDKNKSYHIVLTGYEKQKTYSIPEIYTAGKVMRLVSQSEENLIFKISQKGNLKKETIHIRVQAHGEVYNLATTILDKEIKIKIPLKEFPQGIAEITLFNDVFEPLCERLVFVKPDQKLNITTTLNKSEYQIREKGQLKIKVSDEQGNPVIAHLGLSIFDRIYQNKEDSKTIESHYYLSTQLKGKLYNPAYYFNEQNQNHKEALDALLLTQGWRRYIWSEANLKAQKPKEQILFEYIGGIAKIKKNKKVKQLGSSVIKVFNPELKKQDQFIILDSLGNFVVNSDHLKLGERNYAYFKFMVTSNSKDQYSINNNWFKSINTFRKTKLDNYPLFNFKPLENENVIPFKLYADVKELDEIVLNAKKGQIVRNKYLGKLDSIVRLDIIDWIAEPCKTLNCPFHPYMKGNELPEEGKSYLQYVTTTYVNGKPKEILTKVLYKKQKLTDEYLMSRFNLVRIKGYYGKREFYQPVYDEKTINDPFPDYRNTLFWKPDIITNEQGEAVINFFCSDINSIFLGKIEGVSGDGLLGSQNFKFAVRKLEK